MGRLLNIDTALVDAMRGRRIEGEIRSWYDVRRDCTRYHNIQTGWWVDVANFCGRRDHMDALRGFLDGLEDHYRKDEREARDQFQEPHMVLL